MGGTCTVQTKVYRFIQRRVITTFAKQRIKIESAERRDVPISFSARGGSKVMNQYPKQ
jgi:hypothetical protein